MAAKSEQGGENKGRESISPRLRSPSPLSSGPLLGFTTLPTQFPELVTIIPTSRKAKVSIGMKSILDTVFDKSLNNKLEEIYDAIEQGLLENMYKEYRSKEFDTGLLLIKSDIKKAQKLLEITKRGLQTKTKKKTKRRTRGELERYFKEYEDLKKKVGWNKWKRQWANKSYDLLQEITNRYKNLGTFVKDQITKENLKKTGLFGGKRKKRRKKTRKRKYRRSKKKRRRSKKRRKN